MRIPRLTKQYLTYTLYAFGMIMYAVIFLLGISNMAETKRNTEAIKNTTSSTNRLVAGQTRILGAIKEVTEDGQITANQQTAIIICMLQVPIAQRTTDLQLQCRKNVTGSATVSSTSRSSVGASSTSAGVSSSHSTPTVQPTQSNSSQPTTTTTTTTPTTTQLNCTVNILFVHIAC